MQSSLLILVINSGSSSLKLSLFTLKLDGQELKREEAHLSNIQTETPSLSLGERKEKLAGPISIKDGLQLILERLGNTQPHVVGHRVVHGGDLYTKSTLIDAKVVEDIQALARFAPLHNPACAEGILAAQHYFPSVPQVAVFDTAFHTTLPPQAYTYGVPQVWTQQHHVRRYGFHGIAHQFLWEAFVKVTGKEKGSLITAHLGNGCSAAAIKAGKSLDTSMGFTPTEGLLMSTRCGDLDPGIMEYIAGVENLTIPHLLQVLNQKSGLLGISDLSSDMKTLLEDTSPNAQLAIDVFCYRLRKYLGAYLVTLCGADAIFFSGGIGENAPLIRQKAIDGLAWLGVSLDDTLNKRAVRLTPGYCQKISSEQSKIEVYAAGADENKCIALQSLALFR